MLLRNTRCAISGLRCNGHSLLLSSYLSRIGRIENPSYSACGHLSQDISHLILHCPAIDFLATLCFFTTSGPGSGELPGFWGSMVFRHASIPRKGSGNNNNMTGRLLGLATSLPDEDGEILLSTFPKGTTSELAGFSPHCPFRVERQGKKL